MSAASLDDGSEFEVIVIGGGITGLAVARAVAQAGLSVALLDRANFGEATSANSLRIIHGGFRYLQSFDVMRVIRSLRDQARVQREFPSLVRPLPCYLPLKKFGLKSRWPLVAASFLYRAIGKLSGVDAPMAGVLSKEQAERALPVLTGSVPNGAFRWHDLQLIEPQALHQTLATQISSLGGVLCPKTSVGKVCRTDAGFSLSVVRDGQQRSVRAAIIVNAGGPWVESLMPEGAPPQIEGIGWCRGFNLVFEGNQRGTFGAGFPGEQGRLYFAVGRDGETAVGTDYLPLAESVDTASVSEAEIDDFISRVARAAPAMHFSRRSLKRVELGVLPLESTSSHPERGLIGSARIWNDRGYIAIVSTKYTTFLSQADEVVGIVASYLKEQKERR